VGQAYEGAERNIRTRAQAIGINADEVLARYKVTSSVRHETARRWHLGELRDVTENRSDLDPEGARTRRSGDVERNSIAQTCSQTL